MFGCERPNACKESLPYLGCKVDVPGKLEENGGSEEKGSRAASVARAGWLWPNANGVAANCTGGGNDAAVDGKLGVVLDAGAPPNVKSPLGGGTPSAPLTGAVELPKLNVELIGVRELALETTGAPN